MTPENANGPTSVETLFGGADFVVLHSDGAKETVHLKQLTLASFPALLASQDDEVAVGCLYTGKDATWFNSLTMESQEQLITEGERINADFFVRWFQRRLAKQERLMPGLTEKAMAQAAGTAPPRPALANTAPPLRRPQA